MNSIQRRLVVVAAVIRHETDGRLLLTLRHQDQHLGGLWEFPGGKVGSGETLPDALVRELREELQIRVRVGKYMLQETHSYPDRTVEIHFFECTIQEGQPLPLAVAGMTWCRVDELSDYPMPDANARLVRMLAELEDS